MPNMCLSNLTAQMKFFVQEEQRNLVPARATEKERIVEEVEESESGSDIGKQGGELSW